MITRTETDYPTILQAIRTLVGAYDAGTNVEPETVERARYLARNLDKATEEDRNLICVALFTERERRRENKWDDRDMTRLLYRFGWSD